MSNAKARALMFAVSVAVTVVLHLPGAAAQEAVRAGPIAYVAHGAMFDAAGNEIEPTPEFIARAQDFYRRELTRFAPPALMRVSETLRQTVMDRSRAAGISDLGARSLANAVALDLLINRAAPTEDDRLLGKLATLEAHRSAQERLARRPGLSDLPGIERPALNPRRPRLLPRSAFAAPPPQSPTLIRPGPPPPRPQPGRLAPQPAQRLPLSLTTGAQGQAYRDQCAAAGVPIPPDWGTPDWESHGELTAEFISGTLEAEVFTWESDQPAGMCIALPRWNGLDEAQFLGIICLSEQWSKACFWDNQTGGVQFFPVRGEVTPFSAFGGGADLTNPGAGVCTECHAGQNPYVIHPDTALGKPELNGLPLFSDDWYAPLVRAEWPQNPGPLTSPGACAACHFDGGQGGAFAIISSDLQPYCDAILEQAIEDTMPPSDPGGLAGDPHAAGLLAMCNDPPPDEDVVVVGEPSAPQTGVSAFGTATDVFVIRSNDGSRQKLWGTRQYADVTATANLYCQGIGGAAAASWEAGDCGEDESSYMRFNLDTDAWESMGSGSRDNPPGECLYALLSEVTCAQ